MSGLAFATTTPSCVTAAGSRGEASVTLFCTCTWAMSGLVPVAKLSVMLDWPLALEFELKYNRLSMPVSCCSITCVTVDSMVVALAPRVRRSDRYLGWRDVRIRVDSHGAHGDEAEEGDQDRDDPREDRTVDEETRHGCPYRGPLAAGALPVVGALPGAGALLAGGCHGLAFTGAPSWAICSPDTITRSPFSRPWVTIQLVP